MCHKMIQSLLIILSLVISSYTIAQTSLSQDTGYTKVFNNMAGCSGFNIVNGSTMKNNTIECASACDNLSMCHGFSYNSTSKDCRLKVTSFCMNQGNDEAGYIFYTRNAMWSRVLDQEVAILKYGYEKVADGDCLGSDLGTHVRSLDDTLVTCAQWCSSTEDCRGFSFSHADKRCILKSINECQVSSRVRGYYQFYGKVK